MKVGDDEISDRRCLLDVEPVDASSMFPRVAVGHC